MCHGDITIVVVGEEVDLWELGSQSIKDRPLSHCIGNTALWGALNGIYICMVMR
jgi:hypothetical protein